MSVEAIQVEYQSMLLRLQLESFEPRSRILSTSHLLDRLPVILNLHEVDAISEAVWWPWGLGISPGEGSYTAHLLVCLLSYVQYVNLVNGFIFLVMAEQDDLILVDRTGEPSPHVLRLIYVKQLPGAPYVLPFVVEYALFFCVKHLDWVYSISCIRMPSFEDVDLFVERAAWM